MVEAVGLLALEIDIKFDINQIACEYDSSVRAVFASVKATRIPAMRKRIGRKKRERKRGRNRILQTQDAKSYGDV